jgi:hypothetical protein
VSPAREEKQANIGAADPAGGMFYGPLRDTAPRRVRLFLEIAVRMVELCGLRLWDTQSGGPTPPQLSEAEAARPGTPVPLPQAPGVEG